MKHKLLLLVVIVTPFLASCGQEEPERKAVPPTSTASKMPWNRPMPGEGSGQFGGMLQRR
jgi:nitrous oxide reductase accessory protein NosL